MEEDIHTEDNLPPLSRGSMEDIPSSVHVDSVLPLNRRSLQSSLQVSSMNRSGLEHGDIISQEINEDPSSSFREEITVDGDLGQHVSNSAEDADKLDDVTDMTTAMRQVIHPTPSSRQLSFELVSCDGGEYGNVTRPLTSSN
jgi:hypothetical protein